MFWEVGSVATDESTTEVDRDRRREVAKDALDVGMDDPYWLHNLSRSLWFQADAYGDLLSMAEKLEEDAQLLRDAHEKIEEEELIPAEAALFVAENANHGDYDTHGHLYDNLPIQGREEP